MRLWLICGPKFPLMTTNSRLRTTNSRLQFPRFFQRRTQTDRNARMYEDGQMSQVLAHFRDSGIPLPIWLCSTWCCSCSQHGCAPRWHP